MENLSSLLEISHVSMTYANGTVKAVDDLSLSLKPGEIFGFLGQNGAGKTTTIKMLTGILPVKTGSISVCGHDIMQDPIAAKQCFGYVPDSPTLFDKYTGREYIDFLGTIYGVTPEQREQRVQPLLNKFELSSAFDSRMSSYSHGMKQKIAIIGALLHDPDLWVLDEPMTGLDPTSAFALKELMRAHRDAGKTVFFSTHVLDVAEKLCDRVGIIKKGKLIRCGDIDELKSAQGDDSLEELFISLANKNE